MDMVLAYTDLYISIGPIYISVFILDSLLSAPCQIMISNVHKTACMYRVHIMSMIFKFCHLHCIISLTFAAVPELDIFITR